MKAHLCLSVQWVLVFFFGVGAERMRLPGRKNASCAARFCDLASTLVDTGESLVVLEVGLAWGFTSTFGVLLKLYFEVRFADVDRQLCLPREGWCFLHGSLSTASFVSWSKLCIHVGASCSML